MSNQVTPAEEYISAKQKFNNTLRSKLSAIIVGVAAIFFVFKDSLNLSRTGKDLLTIIMSISMTYFFTIYISKAMRDMGKRAGKETDTFKSSLKYVGEAKDNLKGILYLTGAFVRYKNQEALEEAKRNFLEENGLSYKLYKAHYYDNNKELSELEKKILFKVNRLKITKLTSNQLLTEHSTNKRFDPLYLGKSEKVDSRDSFLNMLLSKALMPIIFGYFAVTVSINESIIWGIIQTTTILLVGVTHYMEGEEYILTELRNRLINKGDLMVEMKNLYDKHPEIFAEEDKKIKELEANMKPKEEIKTAIVPMTGS